MDRWSMKANRLLSKGVVIPAVLLLVMALAPVVLSLSMSKMTILIMVLLYMYWASAWNIMGGYAGLFSLGNGIFIGLGAYVTACLFTYAHVSPWFGLVIAGVLTGFMAVIIGYPTFRLQNIYYSLATCALLSIGKIIFSNFDKIGGLYLGGSDGFKIAGVNRLGINMQFGSKIPYYYIILGLLVVILLVSNYIKNSKLGYYFRAISANDMASSSLGVNVVKLKMQAQFISAFFTAVGGGFYAMFISYIAPTSLFGIDMSINIMIMCVVGGSNTLWGPIVGAGILYTLDRVFKIYLASKVTGLATVIFGVILMVVVYYIPGGIVGWLKGLWEERPVRQTQKKAAAQTTPKGGVK
jgi:branched-chain amino acid transport system permease protein